MSNKQRLKTLETTLHNRLDTSEIDVSLIMDAIKAIQLLGERPNDVFKRLSERCKDKTP